MLDGVLLRLLRRARLALFGTRFRLLSARLALLGTKFRLLSARLARVRLL